MSQPAEHPLSLVPDLALVTLRGVKKRSMRPMTAQNSIVSGGRRTFEALDFGHPDVFVDRGPSPAMNAGPYLHVPYRNDPVERRSERVYPRWQPGDLLWIREPARVLDVRGSNAGRSVRIRYEADGAESDWLPYPARLAVPVIGLCVPNGVHREGARTRLRITAVKAQRPVDITEEEARAEGVNHLQRTVPPGEDPHRLPCVVCGKRRSQHFGSARACGGEHGGSCFYSGTYRGGFLWLYQGIYGHEALTRWCWAYDFERLTEEQQEGQRRC